MFTSIMPEQLTDNFFTAINEEWMLITAGDEQKANTMTASWGGMGILFSQPVATVYIRPSRYTKQFVDSQSHFSLTFFDAAFHKTLAYLGAVSGRDEDKVGKSGLTLVSEAGIPYFEQARLAIFCRKLYAQDMDEAHFIDRQVIENHYPERDFHTLYIGAIEKVLLRK